MRKFKVNACVGISKIPNHLKIKDKILSLIDSSNDSTCSPKAKERIKELEVLIAAWEETLPKRKFGEKNDHVEPTITTPNGEISETLMSGTLRDHYMEEHREY